MSIFKKAFKEVKAFDDALESIREVVIPEPEEEWIWVEGYKGTDKNMQCRGLQFELGTQYNMPEGQEIVECRSGFHLCVKLQDVFDYYSIGDGNRFFKVKALVRKADTKRYESNYLSYFGYTSKLTSKSIIFLSELTADEILKGHEIAELPEQYRLLALETSVKEATAAYQAGILIEDGYSEAFAYHIANNAKFKVAHALASQKDLSMDVKVLTMFCNK